MQQAKQNGLDTLVSKPATGLDDFINAVQEEILQPVPTKEEILFNKIYQSSKITLQSKFDKPKTLLYFKDNQKDRDINFGSLGNFSLLIGKAKSKKTFLTSILTASFLNRNGYTLNTFRSAVESDKNNLIYFDTEQGGYHSFQVYRRIFLLSGLSETEFEERVQFYCLRPYEPKERLLFIEQVLQQSKEFGLVVIDGIADLVTSINDEEQATMITTKLLNWSSVYDCHITTILHQNKGDNNARGHLGTYAVNKAEVVLEVSKENEQVSAMKIERCRDLAPEEPFYFRIEESGLPVQANEFDILGSEPKKQKGRPAKQKLYEFHEDNQRKILDEVFKRNQNRNGLTRGAFIIELDIVLKENGLTDGYGKSAREDYMKYCIETSKYIKVIDGKLYNGFSSEIIFK